MIPGIHWIQTYCQTDRTEFYKYLLEEHHFTPETVSTQFTILQLLVLYNSMGDNIEQLKEIINNNDDVLKVILRKKGRLKSVHT